MELLSELEAGAAPALPPAFAWLQEGLFVLYLGALAFCDHKKRTLPPALPLGGAAAGLLLRLGSCLFFGQPWDRLPAAYLPGLLIGLALGGLSLASKGAVGSGDAVCFLSFALWIKALPLFLLLFGALCLCAGAGIVLLLTRKKERKSPIPFLPFVLAAELIRLAAALFGGALP